MTKQDHIGAVKELIEDLKDPLIKEATRLLNSGAIDVEEYQEPYKLAKILMTVAIDNKKNLFAPPSWMDDANKEIKNLKHF